MSQSTYVPPSGPTDDGAAVLTFFTNVLAAIRSGNSGPAAPTETAAGMIWADTSGAEIVLKLRNAANTGWVAIWPPESVAFDPTGTDLVSTDIDAALRELAGLASSTPAQTVGAFGALQTAAASASLEFDGMDDPNAQEFVFTLANVKPSSDGANLFLRVSDDGGATYEAAGYSYGGVLATAFAGVELESFASVSAVGVLLGVTLGSAAEETGWSGEVRVIRPQDSASKTIIVFSGAGCSPVNRLLMTNGAGRFNVAGAHDAVQFVMSAGNIASGTIAARKIMRPA